MFVQLVTLAARRNQSPDRTVESTYVTLEIILANLCVRGLNCTEMILEPRDSVRMVHVVGNIVVLQQAVQIAPLLSAQPKQSPRMCQQNFDDTEVIIGMVLDVQHADQVAQQLLDFILIGMVAACLVPLHGPQVTLL